MITSQGFGKICKFSDLTPQLQTQDHLDNSKLIYLPGTDCLLKTKSFSLSAFTSYRVGGEAECYVAPRNLAALQASIEYAKENDLTVTILGAGSNLLVAIAVYLV